MTLQEIKLLHAYNSWADNRIIDAVLAMPADKVMQDLKSSHGGIHRTLVHIVAAEKMWLSRWVGKPDASFLSAADAPTVEAVKNVWVAVGFETARFLGTMSDKKLQGSVLLGYVKFIRQKWGADGVSECGSKIGLDLSLINEGRWYNHDISKAILKWIAEEKGLENVERCGNFSTKELGFLSYLVRFVNVKSLLKRAPESYANAFSWGRLTVSARENSAVIRMHDASTSELDCVAWLGAFRGMLEQTRTKGTVKETQCQSKGAPHCEFLMEWK